MILRNGLEAAAILLAIMTSSPAIDRRLISEDAIESCILLLRHHLTKNVAPCLTNTGHLMAAEAKSTTPKKAAVTPRKRRRSSGGADQGLIKELKKVYRPIMASIPQLLVLFEGMERLVYSVQMEDQPLLTLSSASMSVFAMESSTQGNAQGHLFNVASIGLLTAISRQHPKHRSILVEDLFPILLQLPTSKKSQRTYPLTSPRSLFSPKKILSNHHLSGDSDCIQAMSVLIVSLMQSCVTFPTYEQDEQAVQPMQPLGGYEEYEEVVQKPPTGKMNSGLGDCQSLCDQFVSQLLQRCSRKGEDGGASEFRPVLSSLVDDFLIMQLLPEHPAAEMILLTLSRGLGNDIFKASSSSKSSKASANVESTYLSTAFDILGKISASVAAILVSQREKPLSISRQIEENLQSESEGRKVNSCFCGRHTLVEVLMVSCDTCKGFSHAECIDMPREMIGREKWNCDDCKLKHMAMQETKAFCARRTIGKKMPEGIPPIMETHVFRQLVLTYLSDETDSSPGTNFAREFLLAQWVKDLGIEEETESASSGIDAKLLSQQFLDLWNRPLANPMTSNQGSNHGASSLLNKDGYHRLMIALAATKSDLVASFPRQMGLLIQFMADEAFVSIRKLAVKALSQVVDADAKLMLHPAFKKAVSARFADEAKSVREAVVGLVGSFVVSSPELANAYHSSFLPRLQDEGVSVKKRTVKIFRDILMTNPNYNGRAAACALMLKRAADPKEDDSVRDLIHELFTELWLENSEVPSPVKRFALMADHQSEAVPEARESNANVNDASSIVTPNSEAMASPPRQTRSKVASNIEIRCRMATEQMIEVVLSAGSKDVLTALLRDLLSGFSDADKDRRTSDRKKRKRNTSSHCAHLADALVEHLLTLEDNRGKDAIVFGKKLVANIRTISAIAEVSPQEVLRHVDTLLPYLKADNGIAMSLECDVVSEVCDIVYRVTRMMLQSQVVLLAKGPLSDDLVRITYRFGSSALASAVRTLCELGSHPALTKENAFRAKAMKLANTFYGYLFKSVNMTADFSKTNKKTQSNVQRALSVLGCLCKSHEVDNEDMVWLEETLEEEALMPKEDVTWEHMIEACYKLFITYLAKSDVDTKCSALKALGGIFISRPRVLLTMQQAGTIGSIMSTDSEPELQLQALRCWQEILLAEEKRVESGEAKSKMDSNQNITLSNKISGDQDSDATLVGGVLTQHSPRLYQMTKDRNERIRYACVDLLSHLLRQGLLNPFQTIPYLFGLQGDVDAPDIRALALKLLTNEGEKRPDMLRQRICAGVKNAFLYQQTVYPNKKVTAGIPHVYQGMTTYESIFGSVFKESIRNTKKQKQGLFTNLLGLFDMGDADDVVQKKKEKVNLPLLSFTAEVLAYLPYNTSSDPLYIIYHIQAATALQGAQHLDRMIAFLQEQGFPVDVNDENNEEDDLEIAAKAKRPSGAPEAARLTNRKFDILGFEELCETASSFTLLLRLKSYLRKVYKLSETRCIEYSPEGQERNFDKIASTSDMPIFDSKIAGFFRHDNVDKENPKEKDVSKDGVILQYAEFRRLLRMEQTVGARITESDDEMDHSDNAAKSGEEGVELMEVDPV